MKSPSGSSWVRAHWHLALAGIGLLVSTFAATACNEQTGRKLELTLVPSAARGARVAVAQARQIDGEIKVRVRVARQGMRGRYRAHTVRVARVNDKGLVTQSAMRRISPAALNRRGTGYQWLTLGLPHDMRVGETLLLSLGPPAAS